MKTRPRIRRATLWGGVVASAALVIVWVWSMVWYAAYRTPNRLCVGIEYGAVTIARQNLRWGTSPYFSSGRVEGVPMWWLLVRGTGWEWRVRMPLWMPLVVSLGVTAAAWRLEVLARRRARVGKCASCGYDRAGLKADAVCPECGAESDRQGHETNDNEAVAKQ